MLPPKRAQASHFLAEPGRATRARGSDCIGAGTRRAPINGAILAFTHQFQPLLLSTCHSTPELVAGDLHVFNCSILQAGRVGTLDTFSGALLWRLDHQGAVSLMRHHRSQWNQSATAIYKAFR
jgi:hypothetical protein